MEKQKAIGLALDMAHIWDEVFVVVKRRDADDRFRVITQFQPSDEEAIYEAFGGTRSG